MNDTDSTPTEPEARRNADRAEIEKFSALASQWWDPHGKFRPLHDINPLRLALIERHAGGLKGKLAIDVGCGGGLVAEGLARMGATVTGIDLAEKALAVARLHALDEGVAVDYRLCTAEEAAAEMAGRFDVVTCLEMLEHVPDPTAVIAACAELARRDARVIMSTIAGKNDNAVKNSNVCTGTEYVVPDAVEPITSGRCPEFSAAPAEAVTSKSRPTTSARINSWKRCKGRLIGSPSSHLGEHQLEIGANS